MDAKSNEVLVMLSDLSAGAEYRVFVDTPTGVGPTVEFHAMLSGITYTSERAFLLNFENGVELRARDGIGLMFFRKIW